MLGRITCVKIKYTSAKTNEEMFMKAKFENSNFVFLTN